MLFRLLRRTAAEAPGTRNLHPGDLVDRYCIESLIRYSRPTYMLPIGRPLVRKLPSRCQVL